MTRTAWAAMLSFDALMIVVAANSAAVASFLNHLFGLR